MPECMKAKIIEEKSGARPGMTCAMASCPFSMVGAVHSEAVDAKHSNFDCLVTPTLPVTPKHL